MTPSSAITVGSYVTVSDPARDREQSFRLVEGAGDPRHGAISSGVPGWARARRAPRWRHRRRECSGRRAPAAGHRAHVAPIGANRAVTCRSAGDCLTIRSPVARRPVLRARRL